MTERREPKTIRDALEEGSSLLESDDPEQAMAVVRRILTEFPDQPDALRLAALSAERMDQGLVALDYMEKAVRAAPGNAGLWNTLGQIHRGMGRAAAAVEAFDKAVAKAPQWPTPWLNKGFVLWDQGRKDEAVRVVRKAIALAPGDVAARVKLGVMELDLGNPEKALAEFHKALEAAPGHPDILFHLGFAHLVANDTKAAVSILEDAVAADAHHAPAHDALGTVLLVRGRAEAAVEHLRRATKINPENRAFQLHLAQALHKSHRVGEAMKAFETLEIEDPKDTPLLVAKAKLLAELGQEQEMTALLEGVLKEDPLHPVALTMLFGKGRSEPSEPLMSRIEDALKTKHLGETDKAQLHFVLGDALDRRGRFETAFQHYRAGNALKRRRHRFDRKEHKNLIGKLIAVVDEDFVARARKMGGSSERPIFIVGMPRSGTTLVEQVLSSHPDVTGAGEREEISELASQLPALLKTRAGYPDCLDGLNAQVARTVGKNYVRRVRGEGPAGTRLTDKMPNNFLHLGLISRIFPRAQVIHCLRHPLDTCLSCFTTNFEGQHAYSRDLGDLGMYYRSYRRLMDHWRQVLDLEILDLRYEDLVAKPDETIPSLIAFLDLVWDDQCLSPHRMARRVATASRWQVRRPIYRTSVGRHRDYDSFLGPLKAALGPTASSEPRARG